MTGQLLHMPPSNASVTSRRLHEQVLDALVERIVSGEFATGDSLPSEAHLCEAYGVSRSSVREALRVLAEKGLIEVRHGLGTRVNPPETWDFMDALVLSVRRKSGAITPILYELHEAREIVEREAAALAAERANAQDLATLQAALEKMRASLSDATAFADADFTFHRTIIEATRNRVLQRMASPIRELLEFAIQVTAPIPGELQRACDEHLAIYDAVRAGDPAAAREAMRDHMNRAREAFAKLS